MELSFVVVGRHAAHQGPDRRVAAGAAGGGRGGVRPVGDPRPRTRHRQRARHGHGASTEARETVDGVSTLPGQGDAERRRRWPRIVPGVEPGRRPARCGSAPTARCCTASRFVVPGAGGGGTVTVDVPQVRRAGDDQCTVRAPQRPGARGRAAGASASAAPRCCSAALDAYVVVTLLVEIIRDLGDPAEPAGAGHPAGHRLPARLRRRHAAARPAVRPVRPPRGHLRLPARLRRRLGAHRGRADSLPLLVAGRALQGLAGGALLPVTMALAGDLFASRPPAGRPRGAGRGAGAGQRPRPAVRRRPRRAGRLARRVLGQHPAGRARRRRRAPGGAGRDRPPGARRGRGSTWSAALLLAVALGAAGGRPLQPRPAARGAAAAGAGSRSLGGGRCTSRRFAFVLGRRARATRLLDPAGVAMRPFLAALAASFLAGAALMVTLVDVQLLAQTLLGRDAPTARCCSPGSWSRCRSARCSAGCWSAGWASGGSAPPGWRSPALAYLLIADWPADLAAAGYAARPAPAGHRPGARRARPGPGDRAAVGRRAAGGAGGPARRGVGRGRGGPDDGHAARRRGAVRLGPAPVPGADRGPGHAAAVRREPRPSTSAGSPPTPRRCRPRCAPSTRRSSRYRGALPARRAGVPGAAGPRPGQPHVLVGASGPYQRWWTCGRISSS